MTQSRRPDAALPSAVFRIAQFMTLVWAGIVALGISVYLAH